MDEVFYAYYKYGFRNKRLIYFQMSTKKSYINNFAQKVFMKNTGFFWTNISLYILYKEKYDNKGEII